MTFKELPLYSLFKWKSNQQWDYVQIKTGPRSCALMADKDKQYNVRRWPYLADEILDGAVIVLYEIEN